MTALTQTALYLGEKIPWPDAVSQAAIETLVSRTERGLSHCSADNDRQFADAMAAYPIASHTVEANAQHYEVPATFFALALGPQRKYSSCLFESANSSLADAEERALVATAEHAGLADGQRILELGCGWGSLSLWMARRYPNATIVAVSNSSSQRAHIMSEAGKAGLANLDVITTDMNSFVPQGHFDRVVSVEMFEHIANWGPLLLTIRDCLHPDGRLFLHVFSHRTTSYRFEVNDARDWIAQHFFSGGIMPSHGLIRQFPELFLVEAEWRWSGQHYARTAQAWLANFDAHRSEVDAIFRSLYRDDARLWRRRWRLFFLATKGLFGHEQGEAWGVSHYRLTPVRK